jgi:hypothetical protein
MSGSVASLVSSLKKAVVTPTNLVVNSGFETLPLTGWDAILSDQTRTSVNPHTGSWCGVPGYDGDFGQNMWAYGSTLTVGQYYSISFWIRAGATTSMAFSWQLGTNTGTYTAITSGTAWTYFKIENKQCLGNTNFKLSFEDASYSYFVDDVWLQQGATAH